MVDALIDFFKDYGYWGMGMLAFLSGTVVPVASEVLQLFFLGVGLNAVGITLVATLGNTLGGITCFLLGMRLVLRAGGFLPNIANVAGTSAAD